jgi:phosphatidate cytidylyltransferase
LGPLTKRILAAAIAIPLLLLVSFWPQAGFFKLLAFSGLLLALWEFFGLAGWKDIQPLKIEGEIALGLFLLPWLLRPSFFMEGRAALLGALLVPALSFLWSNRPLKPMVLSVSVTFFGAAYFGVLGSFFLRLRDLPQGSWHLLWLYAATWAYDTGGYFAGRRWGKHRLAPNASPQKSWEGCAGGFFLTGLALFILWKTVSFYSGFYSLWDVAVLAVLLSFFGQLGDLVESAFKRSMGAKDSGSFFPGHGGLFDRIDSLLFNAPVLFYYLLLTHHP